MLARQRKTGRREEAQGLVAGRVAADAPRALRSRWAGVPDAWHCTTSQPRRVGGANDRFAFGEKDLVLENLMSYFKPEIGG